MSQTLLAKEAVTATKQTTEVVLDKGAAYLVVFRVTAVGGTSPTLDATLQNKGVGSDTWRTVQGVNPAQITATGTFLLYTDVKIDGKVRLNLAVGGTSPTFTVEAIAFPLED